MTLRAVAVAWLAAVAAWGLGARPVVALPLALCFAALLPARTRWRRAVHVCAALLACGFAIARLGFGGADLPPDSAGRIVGQTAHLRAIADTDGDPHPAYVVVYATATGRLVDGEMRRAGGSLRLLLPAYTDVRAGDVLDLTGRIEDAGAGGFGDWLRRRGVVATLAFPRETLVERGASDPFTRATRSLRGGVEGGLGRALPATEATLAGAMVFGNHHALPASVEADLKASGLSHLVVVSAFNLLLLYGALVVVLAPFLGRRRAIAVGVAMALLYGLASGRSAAILRGEVMVALLAMAALSGRSFSTPALLALAAAGMTALEPSLVADGGFQLTFGAAAGIALVAPALRGACERLMGEEAFAAMPAPLSAAVDALVVSIAVTLAVLPVMLATFGAVQLYAPLANAIVNPLVPLAMALTALVGMLGWLFAPLSFVPAAPLWLLMRGLRLVAGAAAGAPGAQLRASLPAAPAAIVWYALLLALPALGRRLPMPARRARPRVERRGPRAKSASRLRLAAFAVAPGLAVAATLIAGSDVVASVTGGSAGPEIAWLDGTNGNAVLVSGGNGRHVLVTDTDAPIELAQQLEGVRGDLHGVDAVVALSALPGAEAWLRVAAAVHAGRIFVPGADAVAAATSRSTTSQTALVPVRGRATFLLGDRPGGDTLELFADRQRGVVRISIHGHVVLIDAGGHAADTLAAWQTDATADVLALPAGLEGSAFTDLRTSAPAVRLLYGSGRTAPELLDAPDTATARTLRVAQLRNLRVRATGERLRVEYRDR